MTPGVFYNCLEIRANLLKPLRLNAFPFDGLITPTFQAIPVERERKSLQRVGKSRQKEKKASPLTTI